MSANADDVIPASALTPPAPPSAVDDIIPPHALHGASSPTDDIDLSEEGTGDLTPHQSGILVKGAIKGALSLGTGAADLGVGPLGLLKSAKHFIAPDAPSFGEMLNTGLEKVGFPKETQTGDTALDLTSNIVGSFAAPALGSASKVAKAAEEAAPLVSEIPQVATDRAAILQRVGIENARNSALNSDAKAAATDWQLSKFDEPAGQAAKAQFDAEKTALQNHAAKIVDETGGTLGTDEDSLNTRGQTMAAPFDKLRKFIETQATNMYDAGKQRLGPAPIQTSNLEAALGDRTLKNELLADGKSGFLDAVKDQLDNLKENNGGQLNVQNAEQFRQFLNGRWSTSKFAVGKLKGALDTDVGQAVGEDVFKPARAMVQLGHNLLDDPEGVSQLFDVDPKTPINRSTPFTKIPDAMARLPPDQFNNVISTLDKMPEELQPEAQAAKAEIKAHLANKVLDAGSSTQGQWNAPAVSKIIKANSAKLQSAFADQPEALAKIQDLDSAGKILKVDQSYPGAAAQAANALKRGAMGSILSKGAGLAGGSVGGTAGAILAGPPGAAVGSTVGASIGGGIGSKLSQGAAERAALKNWNAGTSKLSDLLKPKP